MSKTLHSLIRSLQKAEKRSVKIAAGKEEKSFMKVYEVLEKMPEYDEKKFRAAFPSLSSSALSKAKETVQQHILKVLHHSHYHEHEEIQLLDAITKAQIVKLKGQNELAMEMIVALKPELALMERNALLIYVQQLEIEIIRLRYLKDVSLKDFERKYGELFEIIARTENLARYRQTTHSSQLIRSRYGATGRIGEYEKYMAKQAVMLRFKNKAEARSLLALDQFYIFWFWYYEMKGDMLQQTEIIRQWKEDAEKHKAFLKKFPNRYYYILYQLGVLASAQQNDTLLHEAVKGLSTSISKTDEVEYERLVYLFSVQANSLFISGNYTRFTELKPIYDTIRNDYTDFLNAERDIYMQKQLAVSYLLSLDFSTALNYINEVMNRYPKLVFGMLAQFRVMSMLCHIGLKNYLVLENLCRAFQYFVKGKSNLSATERLIIKFVQQVERNNTANGIQSVIDKFLPEFKKLKEEQDYFFVPLFVEKIRPAQPA
jgi:hypothetical protein